MTRLRAVEWIDKTSNFPYVRDHGEHRRWNLNRELVFRNISKKTAHIFYAARIVFVILCNCRNSQLICSDIASIIHDALYVDGEDWWRSESRATLAIMYLTVDNVDTDRRRVAINDPVRIKEIHHIGRVLGGSATTRTRNWQWQEQRRPE